jgi:hypothetical protein
MMKNAYMTALALVPHCLFSLSQQKKKEKEKGKKSRYATLLSDYISSYITHTK